MAVQTSHPSAFKGYQFGVCSECGARAVYQGVVRNPSAPTVYHRCRRCGHERFGERIEGLKFI